MKSLAIAALFAGIACTERPVGSAESEASTGESTTPGATADSSSASSSSSSDLMESGDADASSTSGSTTGPPVDECPPGVDGLESSGTRIAILTDQADFPEYPPPHGVTHAECSPVDFDDALRLRCTIEGWELPDHDFQVSSGDADVQAVLWSLLDHPALSLEMFAGSGFFPGWAVYEFTVRTTDGELLMFSYNGSLNLDLQVNIDSLGGIAAVDAGCGGRPAVRGHATVEQPWALDFETDEGVVRLFDRETAAVTIAETNYRIVVAGAYVELEGCDEVLKDYCRATADFTVFRPVR